MTAALQSLSQQINVNFWLAPLIALLAGMIASGETILQDPAGHIERGYQDLPQKLRALGAEIEQIEDYAGP